MSQESDRELNVAFQNGAASYPPLPARESMPMVGEDAFEAFMLAVHEYGPSGLGYRKALAAYEKSRESLPTVGGGELADAAIAAISYIESAIICAWPAQKLTDFNWLERLKAALHTPAPLPIRIDEKDILEKVIKPALNTIWYADNQNDVDYQGLCDWTMSALRPYLSALPIRGEVEDWLRKIANGEDIGKCSLCGKWCGYCLDCDCLSNRDSRWEAVTISDLANAILLHRVPTIETGLIAAEATGALADRVREITEALEWYANQENYDYDGRLLADATLPRWLPASVDRGIRARQALATHSIAQENEAGEKMSPAEARD